MNVKTVYMEITNRCNLNCRTCYNRSGLNKETHEMSIEQIKGIIKLFSAYGAKRFLLSGGEPSLHYEFGEIIKLVDSNPEYSFGFVTNGSSRDEKFIDLLNRRPNITLQISLDGSCEEENAKTRGAGHFDMTVNFVKMINNPAIRPLLKMVISQSNLHDVESFYKLAISLGCVPEFAFIYKSGNGERDWDAKKLSASDKLKVLKLIDALNKEFKTDAYLPRCTSKCPFAVGSDDMSVCIKVNGSIQPCQTLYSEDFTLANAFCFHESEFLENLQQLLDTAKKRTAMDFGCSRCVLNNMCGRGCMAEAYNLSRDPLGNDEACLYRKQLFFHYDLKIGGTM